MTITNSAPATHPHIVFRLAWFVESDPATIVENTIHLTIGSAKKAAAAFARDAPELRAHGTRAFLNDTVRAELDRIQTNPVPWLGLSESDFVAGPVTGNLWWTQGIGGNVLPVADPPPDVAPAPAPVVQPAPPPPPPPAPAVTPAAYTPIAPLFPELATPAPAPATPPPPPPPQADDHIFSAYAVEWVRPDGTTAIASIHGGVGTVFSLGEAHKASDPSLRPRVSTCLISRATNDRVAAHGPMAVVPANLPSLASAMVPCDAPWVSNLMATYNGLDKWAGMAAELREKGHKIEVVSEVQPTIPAPPDARTTATEETVVEAMVATEASLPAWLAPKPAAPATPPPVLATPSPASPTTEGEATAADKPKRGRKPKDASATPAETPAADGEATAKKRGRKPKMAVGETAPLALDIDADIRTMVTADTAPPPPPPAAPPLAAVQGPPVVVPADSWQNGEPALPAPIAEESKSDLAYFFQCEQDEKTAVALIHVKRAIQRVRLAADALDMSTYADERDDLMAVIGRLSVLASHVEEKQETQP